MLYDLFTDSKADPCPWIFITAVQTLESVKDPVRKLRVYSDAVITN
jgi:hypothetical protein